MALSNLQATDVLGSVLFERVLKLEAVECEVDRAD